MAREMGPERGLELVHSRDEVLSHVVMTRWQRTTPDMSVNFPDRVRDLSYRVNKLSDRALGLPDPVREL